MRCGENSFCLARLWAHADYACFPRPQDDSTAQLPGDYCTANDVVYAHVGNAFSSPNVTKETWQFDEARIVVYLDPAGMIMHE